MLPSPHVYVVCCLLMMMFTAVISGCAMTRAPELHLREATWGEATEQARALWIEVVADNPTPRREATTASGDAGAVRLLEVHYDVELDGKHVYHGRWDARATLAAESQRMMILPAVVPQAATAHMPGTTYRIRGRLHYIRTDRVSEILADLGLRHQRTRFVLEGQIAPE